MKYYSECCGAEMHDWPDRDICPDCLEHTGVEERYEEGDYNEDYYDYGDNDEEPGIQEQYDASDE